MSKRFAVPAAMALLGICLLVTSCSGAAVAGEGAGTARADQAGGRSIFIESGCGGCHTLRDAGTTGVVGPNLDRIRPDPNHVGQFVIDGGVGMPSFSGILTHEQILAVARYVADVAGY
jgi:mono/diheme cytochrome c family protein